VTSRENDPLWVAYKHDKAREKADYWQQEADRLSARYFELMAVARQRVASHIRKLRGEE